MGNYGGARATGIKPLEAGRSTLPSGEYFATFGEVTEFDGYEGVFKWAMVVPVDGADKPALARDKLDLSENRTEKSAAFNERKYAQILRAAGFADFAVDPKLKDTHKPLSAISHPMQLKGRRVVIRTGREYSKDGKYVNAIVYEYKFAAKGYVPAGPDAVQGEPDLPYGGIKKEAPLPEGKDYAQHFGGEPQYGCDAPPHPDLPYATTPESAGMGEPTGKERSYAGADPDKLPF